MQYATEVPGESHYELSTNLCSSWLGITLGFETSDINKTIKAKVEYARVFSQIRQLTFDERSFESYTNYLIVSIYEDVECTPSRYPLST